MKIGLIISCLLLFTGFSLFADEADILEIRQLYTNIIKDVEANILYHSRIKVNEEDLPWRALGTFGQTMDIYFNDSIKTDYYPVIFIKITSVLSAGDRKEEYLFDKDGNLVFVFYEIYYKDDIEHRLYFKNNKLIQYKQGNEFIDISLAENEQLVQWLITRGTKLYDFTFNVLMQ